MKVYQIIEKHFAVEKNIDMLLSTSPFATHTFTSMKRAVEKLDRIICFRMFQQREVYNPISAGTENVSHSYVAHRKIRKVLYCRVKPTTSVEHFVKYNFLSTVKQKEVDYDRFYEDDLLYYAENGEDVTCTITYVYSTSDGELKTKEFLQTGTAAVSGVASVYFYFIEA